MKIIAIVYLNSKEVGEPHESAAEGHAVQSCGDRLAATALARAPIGSEQLSKTRGVWHCWILPQTAKRLARLLPQSAKC
jgi:hypothetical protein